MIPTYEICISVGMNDANCDVLDRSKDIHYRFQTDEYMYRQFRQIKRFRAFWVLDENVFEKIWLRKCLFYLVESEECVQ